VSLNFGLFAAIDLSARSVRTFRAPEEDVRRFFGGGGLAAKLFFDLDDEEAVVLANGFLTGFPAPTACKTSFVFRSPHTGIFGESSVGGKWGAQLARTGFSGLIIRGRSADPVYLFIHDHGVDIRDASDLWGLDTFTAHERLAGDLPAGAQIGLIGPAGENGVNYSSLIFEGRSARAAARTGIGKRFGEKRLKGLAVYGTGKPVPHDPVALRELTAALNIRFRERAAGLRDFGTAAGVGRREVSGDLPIKNFAQGNWEAAGQITGQAYVKHLHVRHHACFMCPIACSKKIRLADGPHAGLETTQPEYETAAALGSNLLHADREGLAYANHLCNALGLDTMSTGVVFGFLFECVEKGIVPAADLDLPDADPLWGNSAAICRLIEKIARREGIGNVLSMGVRHAAAVFGGGSERFAIHGKGLELPMHDPRALVSAGATYATGNRGAAHGEALAYYIEEGMQIDGFPRGIDPHTSAGKGAMTAKMQDLCAVFDALGLCKFTLSGGIRPIEMCRFIQTIHGLPIDEEELYRIGARIYTLKRLYNQRRGLDGRHDTLPPRILYEPRPTGGSAGVLPDLPAMLRDLYAARGWDVQGRVTEATAAKLGLTQYLSDEMRAS